MNNFDVLYYRDILLYKNVTVNELQNTHNMKSRP